MSLNGVDVSGWDHPIDTRALTADFVIVKATEGVQGTKYNPNYRSMADGALASGKLLGFYHYANGGSIRAEADSFYEAIREYKGRCVPALDWEGRGNRLFDSGQDVGWCKEFMDRISQLMGSTCLLYTSKGHVNAYDWSVCKSYPLWGAEYAYTDKVYQGYEADPWQSDWAWGVWGSMPTIHQYGYVNPKPRNGGQAKLDADIFYGTREDWQRMYGGTKKEATVAGKLPYRLAAAEVMDHFVDHPAHGYSQNHRDGTADVETITLSDRTDVSFQSGDRDCSRLNQTCYVVVGALPRGLHMWTGNMREILLANGFVEVGFDDLQRGDILWRQGHTEMYMGDGIEAGARWSETGGIDGQTGDQTGNEITRSAYVRSHWTNAFRCVKKREGEGEQVPEKHKAVDHPVQKAGKVRNNLGMNYRGHVENSGWLDPVRDGQTAGTTGQWARLEALKIAPPVGMELTVIAHIEDVGDKTYKGVRRGKSSGTGSSKTDPIIGTTGKSKRLEAIKIIVTKRPAKLKGYRVMVQAHVEDIGWQKPVTEGKWAGTRGKSLRMEAVRIWLEKA